MAEHSLQLQLTQKLALAPQLQQAIRLLQLNRIELREYIQQTVEANPLLEYEEPGSESREEGPADSLDSLDETGDRESFDDNFEPDPDDWSQEPALTDPWSAPGGYDGEGREAQVADTATGSLLEHLLFQINLAHFSDTDTAIAMAILYALDEDGFLADSVDDIRASLAPDILVEVDEVLAVLHRIQRMEPVGVATRDPEECIRVQLSVLPGGTRGLDLARRIARNYIHLVADHDVAELRRQTGASAEALAYLVLLQLMLLYEVLSVN